MNKYYLVENLPNPSWISLEWLQEKISERQIAAQFNAYKKFKAAVTIQKTYRGYCVRKAIKICTENAITIQKYYRGYRSRQDFYLLVEQRVQEHFQKSYDDSATTIQKWFRGYYSRKYKHDFYRLRQRQREAAKELILCVAHKLHHLLRTKQIPGVYSLQNSSCLSKVEELLASLKFKEYNERVRRQRAEHKRKMTMPKANKGKVQIPVPFGLKCDNVYKKFNINQLHQQLDKIDERPKSVPPKPVPISAIVQPDDGVYDRIASSVRQHDFVKGPVQSDSELPSLTKFNNEISVCPHVLQRPDKIVQFCNEMMDICRVEGF